MNRSIIRTRTAKAAAIAAIAAGGLALAGPAFAAGNPSAGAQATVVVSESITIALTSSPTFNLNPNQLTPNAVAFSVTTNDGLGYSLSLSAPDLSNGAITLPATDLEYSTYQGGNQLANLAPLTNSPAVFYSFAHASSPNGDQYTQSWEAVIPGNTPPGSYATTLQFTAAAN